MGHVLLRSLSGAESRKLQDKLRDLSLAARVHQRYRIVSEVLKGHGVAETADRVGCHFTVAYDWVRRFNESGFRTFEQVPNPRGRPPILRSEQLRKLVEVALSSPAERGVPFSNWSLPKLSEYCRAKGLLPPVTDEWVRRLLRREGLTAQRIRTWKTSHDPDFGRKKTHPPALRALPEKLGGCVLRRVGPLELEPIGGLVWAKEGRPSPATGHIPPTQGNRVVPRLP